MIYILCSLVGVLTCVGATSLLKWSIDKTLVIQWKPFKIYIEKQWI